VNYYINFAQEVFISLLIYAVFEDKRYRENLPEIPCDEPPSIAKNPNVRNNKNVS